MALQEKNGSLEITKEMLEFFHTGKKPLEIFLSRGSGRERWEMHKDEVLADWLKTQPGSRPWAFWEFSAPDHPTNFVPLNVDQVKMVERTYIVYGVHHFPGPETFPEPAYLFESEASYLKRKKLLFTGELSRIPKEDFEPKETYPFYMPDRFGRYSRVHNYEAILKKTRERVRDGGSLAISTFGLPESDYKTRFHIYENEYKKRYYWR